MTRALLGLLAALLAAGASAQPLATTGVPALRLPAGAGNFVRVLQTDDAGRLYAGPRLVVVAPDGTLAFPGADPAFNPPTALDASVFSLATAGETVVAGLGFFDTAASADEPPPTAAGFAVSSDGGATWRRRFAALDDGRDTVVTYGVSRLVAVPTLVPQGAAPLDLALSARGDTIYAAAGLAGLRRSTNGGATWQRLVLPPDSLTVLDPREVQTFAYSPGQVEPPSVDCDPDQRGETCLTFASANLIAYSVLVDSRGTLWVGTANGLNRAVRLPGVADPAWLRYLDGPLDGTGPPANLLLALAEQPATGRVWMAAWNSGLDGSAADEEDGVAVYTGDDAEGRARFATVLPGVRANGFAFDGPRAYVAGRSGSRSASDGLYASDDATGLEPVWRVIRTFRDASGQPLALRSDLDVRAVAVAPSGLWVGTQDGLLRSQDRGASWTLYRASPDPGLSRDSVAVDVYAYPNPFRPGTDRLTRVRLTLEAPSSITLRVFDVSMRAVRTVTVASAPAGAAEIAWDGLADDGRRVANGAYVYTVEAGDRRHSGRLLVYQ